LPINEEYVKDLQWLIEQREKGSFISVADYRKAPGKEIDGMVFKDDSAVT
jgi:hypothetical protein